jgi:hypothetical protein
VQVKSTSARDPATGSYECRIGRVPKRDGLFVAYTDEEIDLFFIVDAEGGMYVVPLKEVAAKRAC